jgi:hypothetical protein
MYLYIMYVCMYVQFIFCMYIECWGLMWFVEFTSFLKNSFSWEGDMIGEAGK